jgi:hypothetical protein
LENVIVEKYYVSDDSDATDTTGGTFVKAGSVTYRVYIDMAKGYKLTSIFGNPNHALKISSDSVFYNRNSNDDGVTYPRNLKISRYSQGTVALDTWITLGQVTQTFQGKTYFGVLKNEDRNGSLLGGINNDGGSNAVPGGLLVNNAPSAGIPLTTADGLDTMVILPTNWIENGILSSNGDDSTIFGYKGKKTKFVSNSVSILNSGVMGVNKDSNQVLVAQLTTKGKLSFELNVVIQDASGNNYTYVARNGADSLTPGITQSFSLIYPVPCGCTNSNYFEYDPRYGCLDSGACKTLVVLGCMDPQACNYNPQANSNLQSLCCYPGFCNNLDISLVCPTLEVNTIQNAPSFDIFPNPVQGQLNLTINFSSANLNSKEVSYEIIDIYGRQVLKNTLDVSSTKSGFTIDVSAINNGLYMFRIVEGTSVYSKKFIKN